MDSQRNKEEACIAMLLGYYFEVPSGIKGKSVF